MVASTEGEQQRLQVLKLIDEKKKIEDKIAEYGLILKNVSVIYCVLYCFVIKMFFFRIMSASMTRWSTQMAFRVMMLT
jgi:hypothetical protein